MLYFARWKIVLIILACIGGVVLTAPNFLPQQTAESLPDWLPHRQISLGLDLQGGSHLLLEVDIDAVINERLESLVDAMRTALRGERIGYRDLGVKGQVVSLQVRKPEQFEQALELIRNLSVPVVGNALSGLSAGRNIEVTAADADRILVELTETAIEDRKNSAIEQSIEIVRRRIDELGTREPTIQRQGADRILVQLPGVQDPERVKRLLGRTAKMVFRLVDVTTNPADAARGRVPIGSELLESDARDADGTPEQYYVVRKRIMLSGDTLIDSQPTYEQGRPVVSFRFDSVGAKRFADVTAKNVGRPFAIVLDGRVISAPAIREPILGGSGIISGNFSVAEAQDLAVLLRAGALPAPLTILEERSVGPALGADSIRAGKIAGVIGFIAVMVFMVLVYGLFGLVANIALIVNVFMIIGALSTLGATLTLPGIAGIVLTMGMAVDANVLVFERIREEVRTGKTPFAAMEAGYKQAFRTIFDANITTFMAAAILFFMGSGPVKGFSVTLGIGIITSVFTAVTVTRLMLVTWVRRKRPTVLPV